MILIWIIACACEAGYDGEAGYNGKLTHIWKPKPERERGADSTLELKENQHENRRR